MFEKVFWIFWSNTVNGNFEKQNSYFCNDILFQWVFLNFWPEPKAFWNNSEYFFMYILFEKHNQTTEYYQTEQCVSVFLFCFCFVFFQIPDSINM